MLIVARVVQGFGAALMTPQTMAVITRIFPSTERGRAMALWGATAGVATLVGPIPGGVLVDGLGWEWIFFINIPVGIVGLFLAFRLVPNLPTHATTAAFRRRSSPAAAAPCRTSARSSRPGRPGGADRTRLWSRLVSQRASLRRIDRKSVV